ncbi:unnamed protein product [Tilletia caries]|nr:unnamed protein product [Tilletia caries]
MTGPYRVGGLPQPTGPTGFGPGEAHEQRPRTTPPQKVQPRDPSLVSQPLELVPDPNLVRWFVERMPQATALLGTDVGPRAGFLLPSMGLVHSSGPPNFTLLSPQPP